MLENKYNWLVTGGAGFIGCHLVRRLLSEGQAVSVLDDFSSGGMKNLEGLPASLKIIRGDIRDRKTVKAACSGVDYVLHHAALVSVPESVARPADTMDINVGGTANVLECARAAGVKRLMFASSSAVYGNGPDIPYREDAGLDDMQSPYALSKQMGADLCRMYTGMYGLDTVVFRYFNVFGPGQNPDSPYSAVIAKFMDCARLLRPVRIDWDGLQSRDFIYVEDVVDANILAAFKGVPGEIYNVASGKTYSLLELLSLVEKVSGRRLERFFGPKRPGDVKISSACIEKIRSIGFRPGTGLERGLESMWKRSADL